MNLLKSLSIYTFANFFNKGLVFLLAIIITHYITEEDFGVLTMLNTYVLLLSVLIGVGAKAALTVKYFQIDRAVFHNYFSALLLSPVILFLVLLLVGLAFNRPLANLLDLPEIWVYYIIIMAFAQILNDLTLTIYRVQDLPQSFALFNIAQGILNFSLSLLFIISLGHDNWQGRAYGIFGSTVLFNLIGWFVFWRKSLLTSRINTAYIKDALRFGVPLIPHLLGAFVIEYSDNVFLERMMGREELGLYSYGYRFGMIIQVLVTSFSLGFAPYLFESLEKLTQAIRIRIVQISYVFLFGLLAVVFFIGWISPFLFEVFIGADFQQSSRYIFWIGLAYFFFGAYSLFANYIHFSGKTYIFSIIAIINVIVNLGLNYLLIRSHGTIGAAYATILSYILVFVITAIIAHRLYPMPWFSKDIFRTSGNANT